jgi:hypothetical protein
MGIAGTEHSEFQRALQAGNWMAAFAAAHSLPVVRLEDALELVLLGATQVGSDLYERLAVRWLTRLLEERRISLHVGAVGGRPSERRPGGAGRGGRPCLRKYVGTH